MIGVPKPLLTVGAVLAVLTASLAGGAAAAVDGTAAQQTDGTVTVADGDVALTDGQTVYQGQVIVGTGGTAAAPDATVEVRSVTRFGDDGSPVETRFRDVVTADGDGQYRLDTTPLEAGEYVLVVDDETIARFELVVQTLSIEFDDSSVENGGDAPERADTGGAATASSAGSSDASDGRGQASGVPAGVARIVDEPGSSRIDVAPTLRGLVRLQSIDAGPGATATG